MVSEVFRSSDEYIQKQLDRAELDQPTTRLILDIADILTGPTSGGNARYLAECMCRNAKGVAERMKEIAERYLASPEGSTTCLLYTSDAADE